MSKPVFVLKGVKENLLGVREPHIYGSATLADVGARGRARRPTSARRSGSGNRTARPPWWGGLRVAPAAVIVMCAVGPARAQGDPEVGRELAQRWCTSCHVVDHEGHGADAGPALPPLLGDGQRTEDELRGWLAAPHPPMPNFDLSRQEIEDIVAYLASLIEQ